MQYIHVLCICTQIILLIAVQNYIATVEPLYVTDTLETYTFLAIFAAKQRVKNALVTLVGTKPFTLIMRVFVF